MSEILARIVAATGERLERRPPATDLHERAAAAVRPAAERRSLAAALAVGGVQVIAECKRRSPSAGVLREPFDAVKLAREYEAGGAAAISVVTEGEHFGGEERWLAAVHDAVSLPVLRKDFVIAERQLYETVLLGADAVLLIARILPGERLERMAALAAGLGLDVLLEVHDEAELRRALDTQVRLIGVNARDLTTFTVDLDRAAAIAAAVPAPRIAVAESGVDGPDAVRRLAARGVRRLLIGEYLLRAVSPGTALRELVAAGGAGR